MNAESVNVCGTTRRKNIGLHEEHVADERRVEQFTADSYNSHETVLNRKTNRRVLLPVMGRARHGGDGPPPPQLYADGRPTLKKFGTFSTPSFHGVGEPYDDSRQILDRDKGTQMFTNRSKKGQTGGNWNEGRYGKRPPVKPLYEGIKFVEEFKLLQKVNMEERKRDLTTNGFKNPGKPKMNSGVGAYWGCIGPKLPHGYDGILNGKPIDEKGKVPAGTIHEMKQMMTMPGKKGYGASTPGCIFGPGPLKDESGLGKYGGREYKWEKDPWGMAHEKEQEYHRKHIESLQGRPPLVSMYA